MNYWIISWNRKNFNLQKSLETYGYVEWIQKSYQGQDQSEGDIVFIYASMPIGQILYMFQITKNNIPYDESSNKEFIIDNKKLKPSISCVRLSPISVASAKNKELSYETIKQLGIGKGLLQRGEIIKDHTIVQHILDNFDVEFNKITNTYEEGMAHSVSVISYERNPLARKECLKKFGYSCFICKMNFEETYGEIGKDFIHVHHKIPISTKAGESHIVNPGADLIPVCPNCHSMLHRKHKGRFVTPEELRKIINYKK